MRVEKEFYTVYEMAERIGRSPKTIYNWIESGLQSWRIKEGKKSVTMLKQEDVDDFLRPEIEKAKREFE